MTCHFRVDSCEQPYGAIVIFASRVLSELCAADYVGRSDPRVYADRDVRVFDIDRSIGNRFDDFGCI